MNDIADHLAHLSPEERALIRWNFRKAGLSRTDFQEFFEYVVREEITQQPLKMVAHQRVYSAFTRAHKRCVVRMPVGFSKCVDGDTLVADGETGARVKISEFVRSPKTATIASWSATLGVHRAVVSAKHDTGTKDCLRITTRSGRSIVTTPEHPFLTPEGWRRADTILAGWTVASPKRLPAPRVVLPIEGPILDLLALLLTEGSTSSRATRFSSADPVIIEMAKEAAAKLNCQVVRRNKYDYAFVRIGGRQGHGNQNHVAFMADSYGMRGVLAKNKSIPDAVFQLGEEQLRRFLAVFWMCDGFVSKGLAGVTLASRVMVEQLQHLLLRIGVQSFVKRRDASLNGEWFEAWALTVCAESLSEFAKVPLWGFKAERVEALLRKPKNPNVGSPRVTDAFVSSIETLIEGNKKASFSAVMRHLGWNCRRGWRRTVFSDPKGNTRAIQKTAFRALCEVYGVADRYAWLWDSGVFWDDVVLVEEVGERRVFDLTVEGPHCFIANDLVAHNTFLSASEIMYELGQDPLTRIGIISASSAQASKPLSMVRAYIEESAQLRLVFPKLRPTKRDGESWTQTALVVDRPFGIRDPSLVALGLDSRRLAGSRLKRVYVDDLLDAENSHTPELREMVKRRFIGEVLSRQDKDDFNITVTNTPRDPDDLTYWLEKSGWPTLTMDAYGDITITNTDFDCADIRPAYEVPDGSVAEVVRLSSHDAPAFLEPASVDAQKPVPAEPFDLERVVSLWPERWSLDSLEERRLSDNAGSPLEWAQTMRCIAYSDDTSKVKRAWIERGQQLARDLGFATPRSSWVGGNTYTGVDLAVGKGKQNDFTCFFTIHIDNEGRRVILDVEYGRWSGTEILSRLIKKHEQFGSIIRIETNAAQLWMKEFAIEADPSLPIRSHNTGKNKTDVNFGLEHVFTDLENGLWVIPSGDKGVERWIYELVTYNPDKHTGDVLMASWFAREQARSSGAFAAVRQRRAGVKGGIVANLMAR